jgi:hypothetical protein
VDTETQSYHPPLRGQAWIDRFQQVASQTELTDDLVSLEELLELPISCCLAVREVLREGNWKAAQHPKAYLKTAAMTQARRMHLSITHKDDTFECGEPALVFMGGDKLDRGTTRKGIEAALDSEDREHGAARPKRLKGKQRVSAQFDPDDEVLERERLARENGPFWPSDCWTKLQISKGLLSAMKAHYADNPDEFLAWKISLERRDWKKLGKKAGLDLWEIEVLEFRRQGISRDRAMELQPDARSRLAIQAAWKRMDRIGFKHVRDFLQKKLPQDVPDEHFRNTRKIEACTPPHPRAAISGNPLQTAWKRTGGRSREDLGRFLSNCRAAMHQRRPTQFAPLVKIIDSECPE